MSDHYMDHHQHSHIHHGSIYARYTPTIFSLLCHHTLAATCFMSLLVISEAKHKIWYSYIVLLQPFSTVMWPHTHTHTLKKQISAVMPSEVMKWHNCFSDDIMHSANLRQKFPWCSNSCKLHECWKCSWPANSKHFLKLLQTNVLHLNIWSTLARQLLICSGYQHVFIN